MTETELIAKSSMEKTKNSAELPQERLQEIAELAEAVAAEYCPIDAVDPLVIVHAEGITFNYGRYEDAYDGLLEHRAGRFHIYCNLDRVEQPYSPRARFTFAHELGHYFIDEHRNTLLSGRALHHGSICEYESKLPIEREADHFASHLLMPLARFKVKAKSKLGLAAILNLKEYFDTSITSTAIHYVLSNIASCGVMKWGNDGLSWYWPSDDFTRLGLWQPIRLRKDLPVDSATNLVLSGAGLIAGGFINKGTTAAAWFPSIKPYSDRNIILCEEALPLGRFGVITFLYPDTQQYHS